VSVTILASNLVEGSTKPDVLLHGKSKEKRTKETFVVTGVMHDVTVWGLQWNGVVLLQ
jgi:hypothetical protein